MTLQDIMILAAVIVVICVGGYTMYTAGKRNSANGGLTDVISIMNFCLQHLDQLLRSIDNATQSIGGINPAEYDNDAEYRRELINITETIIGEELRSLGLSCPLSHDTVVNLSQFVLERCIEAKKKAVIEEKVVSGDDREPVSPKTDISESMTEFYR